MQMRPAIDGCSGCAVRNRREFLRTAAGAATALLHTLGLAPGDVSALTFETTSGTRSNGDELSYPLPASDGVSIDREHEVILVRWQSVIYAFALSCPHQRTMLKWVEKDKRFQCPKHKSKYQPDGRFISGRATRGMDRHPVRRQGTQILVNTAKGIRDDEDPAAWAAARVTL